MERLLEEPSLATTLKGVYFIYMLLPLHVSALTGHLQEEYTIISGSYFLQRIRCFVLLGPIFICLAKFCRCLVNVHL
jgi:hypothetical protein